MPVYLLSTVPCCSTAGVVWRPPHPPRAGSACPGTPLFPPQRQLGRSNPKPGNRPGISSLSPQVTDPPAVQVRGQHCLSQACEIFPRADRTMLLKSHPFPKEAELGKDVSCAPPPPKGKGPRPWEGDEARAHLVPFPHDEVAPAHHEAAGAHVHVAPGLQQSDVFLQERRNGSLDSGQHSLVICRQPGPARFWWLL